MVENGSIAGLQQPTILYAMGDAIDVNVHSSGFVAKTNVKQVNRSLAVTVRQNRAIWGYSLAFVGTSTGEILLSEVPERGAITLASMSLCWLGFRRRRVWTARH